MVAMSANSELRKQIETTVNSFLASYEDGRKANDPSIINRDVTPDCIRQLLPASMCKTLGLPEEFLIPNDVYEKLFADDLALGGMHNTVSKHLTIDVEALRAAVKSSGDMIYHHGETLHLEFSWIFYLTGDGTKISRVIEFADSTSVLRMVAIMKEHGAESGQGQEVDFDATG
ncbi:uncharacterized protein BKA55DRAFT_578605 [Fusarium redolens]|jgi:hypothetical protein|uniref:SnoaL-like domain-containing protein n=1 Tax=Fusarium redolens TaxID=48865 RepID=A0A9P9GC48_FUSRE|nr:uncharacterized protein BKA55DRAFT_578605 [Fusarium redolens]KAH7236824.1 hypothetical protein BKA55DRAFT_578605 [Fusarium redolens]